MDYLFLVESNKIESTSFSYQTALSEVNGMVREIELGIQNEPIRKNGVLPVTTLFF